MDLFNEIKELIVTEFAIDEEAVVHQAHLQDDLDADSLALLNLAEAIGTKYGIEIQGDDLVDLENVGELLDLVKSKIASKS